MMVKKYLKNIKKIVLMLSLLSILCGCDSGNEQTKDAVKLITDAGEYVIDEKDTLPIIINAPGNEVKLVLKNADIATTKGPAIDVIDAAKVIIELIDGTESTLEDVPRYESGNKDKSCISATCDLYFAGMGKLNIHSYHKSAIDAKDMLYIDDCDIYISSKGNGIKANDGIVINNAILRVEAEKSSLVTDKIGKGNKGNVVINNSTIDIIAGRFGIDAKADIIMDNSVLFVKAVLGQYTSGGDIVISDNCKVNE